MSFRLPECIVVWIKLFGLYTGNTGDKEEHCSCHYCCYCCCWCSKLLLETLQTVKSRWLYACCKLALSVLMQAHRQLPNYTMHQSAFVLNATQDKITQVHRADSTIVIRSCTGYPTIPAAKGSIRTECRRTSITGTRRCERITPVLQKLHWLSVHQRLKFKLVYPVHQSLAGQTPSYLASDIQLTADTGRPQLRSASERIMCCSTHTQQLRRQLFCCRPSGVDGTLCHHICGGT